MTVKEKSVQGMFSPVTGPKGQKIDARSMHYKEGKRQKQLVDTDELPAEYKEAVEANEFVIYGKASVEQYDEDGQKVDIKALEENVDQLLKASNISRRHKDVRVGEVAEAHELEEDRELEIGDETFSFKAGDKLATGANPDIVQQARSGEPDDDEFWIAAKIWNDSEIAKDTRLRTLSGDLNGFSVTIYAKETEPTSKGEKVTDVDWHAVTIGSDDKIKNKASRFGLAEFKAWFTDDPTGAARGEVRRSIGSRIMFGNLLKKSADESGFNGELLAAASSAAEKAETEDVELEKAAEDAASDADFKSDDVLNTISVLQADSKEGDDLDEVLQAVEAGEMSAEEAMDVVASAEPPGDEDDKDEEMKEDEDPDDEEEFEEEKEEEEEEEEETEEKSFEEKLEEHGVVTEDKLNEKMDEVTNTVAEKMDDAIPSADDIAEKMDVGSTPDADSGNGGEERSIVQEMKSSYGGDN